jgi:hypothetical protein
LLSIRALLTRSSSWLILNVGRNMMLIFNHDQPLAPEEITRLADASPSLVRRAMAGGCPTKDGRLSYSAFAGWVMAHYRKVLNDFAVETFPASGYYSELDQFWILRPVLEWVLHEEEAWLDVGGPGCDGIAWALRRGQDGVFAYYPIGGEFVWKAVDAPSLIWGWQDGKITA